MDTLQKVILSAHTLIAVLIIVLVLLQRGKGADAGAAFGAGASGTVFGSRGSSSFFSRLTAVFATAFFASSLTLAYLSSQRTEAPTSLLESVESVDATPQATPAGDEPLPVDELPSMDDTDVDADALPGDSDEQLPSVPADEEGGQ